MCSRAVHLSPKERAWLGGRPCDAALTDPIRVAVSKLLGSTGVALGRGAQPPRSGRHPPKAPPVWGEAWGTSDPSLRTRCRRPRRRSTWHRRPPVDDRLAQRVAQEPRLAVGLRSRPCTSGQSGRSLVLPSRPLHCRPGRPRPAYWPLQRGQHSGHHLDRGQRCGDARAVHRQAAARRILDSGATAGEGVQNLPCAAQAAAVLVGAGADRCGGLVVARPRHRARASGRRGLRRP